jgi:hypothetical protein
VLAPEGGLAAAHWLSRASLWICSASSRVGAASTAMGPSPAASWRWSMTCTTMGSTNAAVLPLPVLAMPWVWGGRWGVGGTCC